MTAPYVTTQMNPSGNRYSEECTSGRTGAYAPLLQSEKDSSKLAAWVVGSTSSSHFLIAYIDGSLDRMSFDDNLDNTTLSESWKRPQPLIATGSLLEPFFPPMDTAEFSSAIPIGNSTDGRNLLYISTEQKLMQMIEGVSQEVDETIQDVLVDGNIVFSTANAMWAVYSGATQARYVHGILGDQIEGYKLNILKTNADGIIEQAGNVELPGNSLVYEGLNPMWADVDGDGVDDLLTTISEDGEGSALRVYFINTNGTIRGEASSEYIRQGGRWLHQLAVGPLGPNGETEIVEVRTPHVGGRIRYYQYDATAGALINVASANDYTSHDIGSRNTDRATVGDFNNDGIPEVVVQNQAKDTLYGLQRAPDGGIERHWELPLPDPVFSNIAVACSEDNDVVHLLFSTIDRSIVQVRFLPTTTPPPPSPSAAFTPQMTGWIITIFLFFFLWRRAV